LTEPPPKEARVDALSAMTGVPNINTEKIGGITVSSELERLYNNTTLKSLFDNAPSDKPVSKSVLCSRTSGVRAHPAFLAARGEKKYENAMTLVAMSIGNEEWDKLLRHELEENGKDVRDIFSAVETQTMTKAVELEIQSGVRDPSNQITKSQPTLHSLHERLVKIRKGFTKQGINSDNIDDKFLG
jgi:hypothetical protein